MASSNQLMKWGILLSVAHIYLNLMDLVTLEMLPAFIGYFLIMRGMYGLSDDINEEYMHPLKGESTKLFIFSIVYWVAILLFGASSALGKMFLILFYLFDVKFFGNLLNKLVKYQKEKMRLADADRLRKNRMSFIKAYLALIVFLLITLIPNALNTLGIGSAGTIRFLNNTLQYIFISLMLLLKLWLSMIIQKFEV